MRFVIHDDHRIGTKLGRSSLQFLFQRISVNTPFGTQNNLPQPVNRLLRLFSQNLNLVWVDRRIFWNSQIGMRGRRNTRTTCANQHQHPNKNYPADSHEHFSHKGQATIDFVVLRACPNMVSLMTSVHLALTSRPPNGETTALYRQQVKISLLTLNFETHHLSFLMSKSRSLFIGIEL